MLRCLCAVMFTLLLAGCQSNQDWITADVAAKMTDEHLVRTYSRGQWIGKPQTAVGLELDNRGLFMGIDYGRADKHDVRIGDTKLYVYLAWPVIDDEGGLVTKYSASSWVYSSIWGFAYFDQDNKVIALGR